MNKKGISIGLLVFLLVTVSSLILVKSLALTSIPNVTFKTIDGRQINTQQLNGKPVLITFWSTTCRVCVQELPQLISLYNEFSQDGLEVIGVAMSYDPPNQVIEFVQRRQIPYTISLDIDGSIAKAFNNIMATPTSFLIARDGTIKNYMVGVLDMITLKKQLTGMFFEKNI